MKKIFARVVTPAILIIGSLSFGAAMVTAPAGASTHATAKTAAVTAKTYSGVVKSANVAKRTFTLASGTARYNVHFATSTKFTRGTAANIKVGTAVTVVGRLSKNVVHAISIRA